MAKALWFPGADRSQTYDAKYPGMVADRIDCVVLHSTEGVSWPPYNGGAAAPNMTIGWDRAAKRVLYRQHFQANRSARALAGSVNGVSTNRFHVFQIEIIGTSGWASRQNPAAVRGDKGTYILDNKFLMESLEDWQLEGIARVLRWLNTEWGVPLVAPHRFVPWQRDNRMTTAQWSAFKGVCGHQHVPFNDHTDPGAIPIDRILQLAKGTTSPAATKPAPLPSTGTTTPQEDDMPTPADLWKHPLDLTSTDKPGDTKSAGEQLSETNRQATFATREARRAAENSAQALGMIAGLTEALKQSVSGSVDLDAVSAAAKKGAAEALAETTWKAQA